MSPTTTSLLSLGLQSGFYLWVQIWVGPGHQAEILTSQSLFFSDYIFHLLLPKITSMRRNVAFRRRFVRYQNNRTHSRNTGLMPKCRYVQGSRWAGAKTSQILFIEVLRADSDFLVDECLNAEKQSEWCKRWLALLFLPNFGAPGHSLTVCARWGRDGTGILRNYYSYRHNST